MNTKTGWVLGRETTFNTFLSSFQLQMQSFAIHVTQNLILDVETPSIHSALDKLIAVS